MAVKKYLAGLAAAVFLSGCSLYEPVKPGLHRNHFEHFSYDIKGEHWMVNPFGDGFLMSKDGYTINYIYVKREKLNTDLEVTKQRFLEGMEPFELADVQKDLILSNSGVTNFQLKADAPARIDGHDGYRLEYSYTTYKGLDVSGIRCGFIHERWIYHIVYEGLSEHYFPKNRPDFEAFLSSFKVL